MCGIAGVLNVNARDLPQEDLLVRMISMLRHRGPEESGIYIDQDIGLGHARLSIIGLDDGTQPICNEDETLWIIYNGEIFNYIELRDDLEKKGHIFTTQTDTEVILHLYEEMGPACLNELNGQFAFAIWDYRERRSFFWPGTMSGYAPYISPFKMAGFISLLRSKPFLWTLVFPGSWTSSRCLKSLPAGRLSGRERFSKKSRKFALAIS